MNLIKFIMISSSNFFKKTLFSGQQNEMIENPESRQNTKLGPWYKSKKCSIKCLNRQKQRRFKTQSNQRSHIEKVKKLCTLSGEKKLQKRGQTTQLPIKHDRSKTDIRQMQLKPLKVRKYTTIEQRQPQEFQALQKKIKKIPVFKEFNFMNPVRKTKRNNQFYLNYWQKMKNQKQSKQSKILKRNILIICQNKEQKK